MSLDDEVLRAARARNPFASYFNEAYGAGSAQSSFPLPKNNQKPERKKTDETEAWVRGFVGFVSEMGWRLQILEWLTYEDMLTRTEFRWLNPGGDRVLKAKVVTDILDKGGRKNLSTWAVGCSMLAEREGWQAWQRGFALLGIKSSNVT